MESTISAKPLPESSEPFFFFWRENHLNLASNVHLVLQITTKKFLFRFGASLGHNSLMQHLQEWTLLSYPLASLGNQEWQGMIYSTRMPGLFAYFVKELPDAVLMRLWIWSATQWTQLYPLLLRFLRKLEHIIPSVSLESQHLMLWGLTPLWYKTYQNYIAYHLLKSLGIFT